eukprot:scaffold23140_cov178-Amphora_coffeaeformis.AAC.1
MSEFSGAQRQHGGHHRKRPPPTHNNHHPVHTQRRPRRHHQNHHGNASRTQQRSATNPVTPKCSICSAEQPKYKCPKCRDPYCGIECCRKHKVVGCTTTSSSEVNIRKNKYGVPVAAAPEKAVSFLDSSWQEAFEDLDDEWKLKDEMKEALHKSPWLQTELQDGGLQHLLTNI